jgi:hypothetical protein
VLVAGCLALVVGGAVLLACSLSRSANRVFAAVLVAPLSLAAACFVVARYYSYDPYYAPGRERMTEGTVAGSWIIFLVVLAAVAASGAFYRLRPAMALTFAVTWLSAITALVLGSGH